MDYLERKKITAKESAVLAKPAKKKAAPKKEKTVAPASAAAE